LGIYKPAPQEIKKARARKRGEEFFVEIAGRQVPAVNTEDGVRAVIKDKPIAAPSVERYLESKFAESLGPVREAMRDLAKSYPPEGLAQNAFQLYEKFRPRFRKTRPAGAPKAAWISIASAPWRRRSKGAWPRFHTTQTNAFEFPGAPFFAPLFHVKGGGLDASRSATTGGWRTPPQLPSERLVFAGAAPFGF
jgi:hypothetical protein